MTTIKLPESPQYSGTVVSYEKSRRFGFIRVDGHANEDGDLFFHDVYLQMPGFKCVDIGARVHFQIGRNNKGPMAIMIYIEGVEPTLPEPESDI